MQINTGWIPDYIRKNVVGAWMTSIAGAMIIAAGGTYAALNVTILSERNGRIEGLTRENEHLAKNLETIQGRYEAMQASQDDLVSKRSTEIATIYRESLNTLTTRYETVLKDNQELGNRLNEIISEKRQQADEHKDAALRSLNERFEANRKQIADTHRQLLETNSNVGYYRADCEKQDKDSFSNICQHASRYELIARSLREKIDSLEKYGDSLNVQIVAIEGRIQGGK